MHADGEAGYTRAGEGGSGPGGEAVRAANKETSAHTLSLALSPHHSLFQLPPDILSHQNVTRQNEKLIHALLLLTAAIVVGVWFLSGVAAHRNKRDAACAVRRMVKWMVLKELMVSELVQTLGLVDLWLIRD